MFAMKYTRIEKNFFGVYASNDSTIDLNYAPNDFARRAIQKAIRSLVVDDTGYDCLICYHDDLSAWIITHDIDDAHTSLLSVEVLTENGERKPPYKIDAASLRRVLYEHLPKRHKAA